MSINKSKSDFFQLFFNFRYSDIVADVGSNKI